MPNVFITNSKKTLNKFIAQIPLDQRRRYQILQLTEMDKSCHELIYPKDIAPIVSRRKNFEREKFLKEYIDLMGTVNEDKHSLLWWATDMSSKNRFTSRIPALLSQFLSAAQTIQGRDFDELIIFGADFSIIPSLEYLLKTSGVNYKISEHRFWNRYALIAKFFKRTLSVLREWGQIYIRKILALVYVRTPHITQKNQHIIKTFIYDHSFTLESDYRDSFFGFLPDYLKKEEKEPLVLANILGHFRFCLQKIRKCPSRTIIPLESVCSFLDVAKAYWAALWYRTDIQKELLFFGFPVQEIFNQELRRTFCKIQPYHLLHYYGIKNLTKKINAKTFILTYENNPWEKMCLLAFKKYSPSTMLIGYQHTVIPQASVNMFRSSKEKEVLPVPHKILTVGEIPQKIMERHGNYESGLILPACALRFEYLPKTEAFPRQRRNSVLLALEGIFESYKMVNYVLEQLKGASDWKVLIRTHPVLPLSKIKPKLSYPIDSFRNFSLSAGNLHEDLGKTDLVIYWGSTVALEALGRGRPVIHFEIGGPLSFDPLFELTTFKWIVRDGESLPQLINEIYSLSEGEFIRRQKEAAAYLRGYFHPVSEENLRKFQQ